MRRSRWTTTRAYLFSSIFRSRKVALAVSSGARVRSVAGCVQPRSGRGERHTLAVHSVGKDPRGCPPRCLLRQRRSGEKGRAPLYSVATHRSSEIGRQPLAT
ncbi:hypothetical protein NDU88_006434 [Pleurodeles waltl]|uniref:Uncharacterized protein n=1 Tax=Pleurodeles waltl TaxID=8319 RepID=A0AAV7QNJ7_PLEWA|nr:hypothetical protein NDU88_006434 [Pleurodeles waltl]